MRRAVWIALLMLAAGCGGDHKQAAPDHVVLANEDGRWTVYTRCVPGVVGPGYVARVESRDGRVLVDDTVGPGTLNDTDYGGLGAFGWHHARGRPGSLRFARSNAWEISTRACASASRGFGVTASRVLEHTKRSLAVEVDLSDRYTRPRPLMRVRYRYDVEPRALRTEVTVTELCGLGRCGHTGKLAFVKEPKLVVHAGPVYHRVEVLDRRGDPVCWSGAKGPRRGPILVTEQCDVPGRKTVRFGPCRPACLDVEAEDWSAKGGFDDWAGEAATRPAAYPVDTASIDGVLWPCHGGDPSGAMLRRWELAGRRGRSIGALLPAWEGGRGGYDCEPLSRVFGPSGTTWRAELEYSLVR